MVYEEEVKYARDSFFSEMIYEVNNDSKRS
jgi:hypothetical protein